MSGVTVDASVWVAAAELSDSYCAQSRAFLAAVVRRGVRVSAPAFARLEVACALARRRRDAAMARRLTDSALAPNRVVQAPVDSSLLGRALLAGTSSFLRGADALYAVTAQLDGSQLVSWDNELIQRGGAITPTDWLAANPD